MMQQRLTLANGLRVILNHDPQASRSAVLFNLAAGSHHEPKQWPGLAHLFEHVVFSGSRGYQGEQRLMSWAQSEGARLNATTLPTSTAWFFDITAARLADGFARLADMLAFPLLSLDAISQETAVIDAEFRMLSTDSDTLCEAALGVAFESPQALAHFHVGNLAYFGQDTQALQQALRDYHQRFFHADNLTLWLSGPQSFKELTALAEQYGRVFPASNKSLPPVVEPLRLKNQRAFVLQQSDNSRLHLTFALKNTHPQGRQSISLLRQFFSDEAEKSLLAILRTLGLCDTLNLMVPYSSQKDAIVTFEFMLNSALQSCAAQVEGLFFHWLQALSQVGELNLNHYAMLAQKAFNRLTPVDRLRADAFGFPSITQRKNDLLTGWNNLLSQLNTENLTRLWVAPVINAGLQTVQGFDLPVQPITWLADSNINAPELFFYPQDINFSANNIISNNNIATPRLPEKPVILPYQPGDSDEGILILGPELSHPLSLRWGYILQASLRAIIGHCAHLGGTLSFENIQGRWLLQLSGRQQVLINTLEAVIDRLNGLPEALIAQGERQFQQAKQRMQTDVAIRCLLKGLPRLLSGESLADAPSPSLPDIVWRAELYGGDAILQARVSSLLSRFPGAINAKAFSAPSHIPPVTKHTFSTTGKDAAVLLFCPLVEQTAVCHAAWRILASLFEPRFFQRLRVEQNIGYVVTCRFMPSAGEFGLLFVVQSPTHSVEQIISEIRRFIGDMNEIIVDLPQRLFTEKCADLLRSLEVKNSDSIEQAREHWLSQHAYAPALTAKAISSLTREQLMTFYQRLNQGVNPWWVLNN